MTFIELVDGRQDVDVALPRHLLETLQISLYLPRAYLGVHCHPIVPKAGPSFVCLRSVE
jgi:hypothetical protein